MSAHRLIGVDARVLGPGEQWGLGVRRYAARVLEQVARADDGGRVVLYGDFDAGHLRRYRFDFPYRRVSVPIRSSSLWDQVRLPLAARRDGVAAFWSPSYVAPLYLGRPRAVTIHDISFDDPGAPRAAGRLRMMSRRSADRATLVLTDSEYSRRRLLERWGVVPNKVRVIPLAADPPAEGWEARAADTLARLDVSPPYVLYVGTLYSRRRIPTLLAAYAELQRRHPDLSLVLVGRNQTDPREPIEEQVEAINARAGRPAVRHLLWVSDEDLGPLYGRALAFAYLSTLEGFGIPPLEAMAYGLPVVSTAGGSLAEVTADAARLVDPMDATSVCAGLEEVVSDPSRRAELRCRSLANAARFSWERCARETWGAVVGLCDRGEA